MQHRTTTNESGNTAFTKKYIITSAFSAESIPIAAINSQVENSK